MLFVYSGCLNNNRVWGKEQKKEWCVGNVDSHRILYIYNVYISWKRKQTEKKLSVQLPEKELNVKK